MSRPTTYTSNQMLAHWAVVFLVAFQFATGWAMSAAFDAGVPNGGAVVHAIIGSAIFAFMLWRVHLRRTRGAPPPPETEPSAIQWLSRGTHYAFYLILLAMPVFGLAAVLTGIELLAEAHAWAAWTLGALIILHIAGALWHATKRDGTVHRMARREPPVVT